jgi:hypothetical protein
MDEEIHKFVSNGNTFELLPPKPNQKKDTTSFIVGKLQKQVIYLWEDESEMFIKSIPPPSGKYIAKIPPWGQEFEISHYSHQVVRAIAAEWEVTKEEYDKNQVPTKAKYSRRSVSKL